MGAITISRDYILIVAQNAILACIDRAGGSILGLVRP